MKTAKKVTDDLLTHRRRRQADTLAALVSQLALQMQTGLSPSVIEHLCSCSAAGTEQEIELQKLVSLTKRDGQIHLKLIDEARTLVIGDLLTPAATGRLMAGSLQRILIQREVSVPVSVFRRVLCKWSLSTPFQKALLLSLHADYAGAPCWLITANFNHTKAAMVTLYRMCGVALGRKLRRELKQLRRLGPTALNLEETKDGRVHLHGICLSQHPQAVIEDALEDIAGMRGYKRGKDNATDAELSYCSAGSVLYNFKDMGTEFPEDATTTFMSHEAVGFAKSHQILLRDALGEAIGDLGWFLGRPAHEATTEIIATTPIYPPADVGLPRPPLSPSNVALLTRIGDLRASLASRRKRGSVVCSSEAA